MRTVAALTMIMAIVVAAIPVENYGTMQAADETPNLSEKAETYLFESNGDLKHKLYDKTEFEDDYKDQSGDNYKNLKTVQHITDGRFINAYKIALKDNSPDSNAIITESIFENDIDSFDIFSKEYYGYVQMNDKYIQAVQSAFDDESYQLTFATNTVPYNLQTVTVEGGGSLDSINVVMVSKDSPSQNVTGSTIGQTPTTTALSGVTNNDYTQIKVNTGIQKAIETYAPQLLKTHTDRIDTYSTQLKQYTDVLDGLKEKSTFTVGEANSWNSAVQNIRDLMGNNNVNVNALTTFAATFADIRGEGKDEDANNLADIVDYTICNRLKDTSNNDLSNYRLDYLTDVNNATVYVPINNTGIKSAHDDDSGYLASGSATIRGIASNAFDVTYINNAMHPEDTRGQAKTITIPETVQFIGERAFAHANYLEQVVIDESRCSIIGDEAFMECRHLNSIKFTAGNSGLKEIGSRAFYNTSLSNISFPSELKTIGAGCFYLSDKINTISMVGLKNGELEISPYAFFGCYNLENVNFTDPSTNFKIGEAAFALPANRDDEKMKSFTFPSNMDQFIYSGNEEGNNNDYILAGRAGLQEVELPGRLGQNSKTSDVPDNMFWGCANLNSVKFPENAYLATYDSEKLFKSVTNSSFCVEGPAYIQNTTNASEPRKCTWNAVPGFNIGDEPGVVPYKYTLNGKEYMEIGVGEEPNKKDDYIASIDILDREQKNAALTNYINNKGGSTANDRLAVKVPSSVGGYKIIEIADGCFETVKKSIYKVTIEDNSVQRINANAFKDCTELQWVELGDSVKYIGAGAFSGCNQLENVVFSQTQTSLYGDNVELWTAPGNVITIEPDAFNTGSKYLTFHGAINPNYGPYNYAMSAEAKNMLSGNSTGICYKTDAPWNLTVMRNEATGERTLIDYPHYEEIDVINKDLVDEWKGTNSNYSITDKFEEKEGLGSNSSGPYDNYNSKGIVNEKDIVLNALNISLPGGIDSVDSKSFFTNEANTDNADYLTLRYVSDKTETSPETKIERKTDALSKRVLNIDDSKEESDVIKLYSTYEGKNTNEELTTAGLYSGYFHESPDDTIWGNNSYNGHSYTENNNRGNDYLTTISLPDVVKLPAYAFDSCENLSNVSLGNRLSEIGALPFRDCKNLREVNFPDGNNVFTSQNAILYKNIGSTDSPKYEILECFEGRGGSEVGYNPIVGVYEGDLLTNITSIAEDAFSNCKNIQEVNLKGTQVTKIPAGCFEGCEVLNSVTLPDSIEEVHDRAFTKLGEDVMLKLYVPNKRCTLASGAFDGDTTVMIYGKKYENEATGEESACYKSWKQVIDALFKNNPTHDREYWENKVQFVDEGNEYIQTFVNKDLQTIDVCKINPKSPDNDRDPKDALVARDIPVAPEYTGLEFVTWMCRVDAKNDEGYEVLTGTKPGDQAFTNIKEDRMFIPNYRFNPSKVVSCGSTHKLNVVGAEYILRTNTGEMIRRFGTPIELDCAESITLMADTRNSTGKFLCWTVTCTNDEGDFTYLLTNASGEMTGFQMPHLENEDSVVTITAVYSDTASRCEVEVINGSGSGFYNGGDSVEISAYSPVNPRQTFGNWTADNPRVSFVDSESSTTTFVMPQLATGQKVVVTASYKDFDPTEGECELEVINGSGSGFYNVGESVTISAYASAVENEVFDTWTTTSTQAGFANASRATTTIIMPQLAAGGKITVTATYKQANSGNGANPDGSYTVTVNNGTGGGNYQPGATVTITANAAPTGQTFTNWTATGVTLSNANSASTTFTMPSSNVTVTANYSGDSSTGKHKVTVNYGSGSGEYAAGETVNITANAPESSSRVFSRWTTSNSGLGFANANAVSTSFVMPATDVTVTANYRARTSDDDDDDDDSTSRRPGTNTSTNTVTNRPGSSTNTTGTTGTVNNPTNGTSSGTTNNNNGNRIYITKNGISNTDVASLAVSGSTDNFIVRITESAEATAAVEQALTNTYGSLNGLAYLPMDISLYDATGQNKITDSTGLNITVTMPIPDVLIQYGGNARVAAADNGNLVQLTPRFTTIDGIACVSFVPPHFSPYVIYVDTNNLIAGQMLDATPATGDPIHPKWFAAIGMACVSVLLFVLSDGRKRKKYRAA